MPLDAHSSEFSRLVNAWLEQTATAEEAERLWQAIAEDAACAREFAAATRFEALLSETVQERAGEKAILLQAAAPATSSPSLTKSSSLQRLPRQASLVLLRAAAILTMLGAVAWLLWPHESAPPVITAAPQTKPSSPAPSAVVSHPPAAAAAAPSVPLAAAGAADKPLPDRLDHFFLAGVALEKVSLRDAVGILQGQLQQLNFLNAEAIKKLRITVPSDAAGRRITFHSGPIAFLKAIRAVAALGGCEVSVDEATLALILHREIFPQVPERRDVRDFLAGRVGNDGKQAADDPERLAELAADAVSLGIALDADRPLSSQTSLLVTRGQWTALQMLTDSREQFRQIPVHNYQMYFTNGGAPNSTNQIITEEGVSELRRNLQATNTAPGLTVTPSVRPLAGAGAANPALPSLTLQPLGEVTQINLALAEPRPSTPANTPVQTTVRLIVGYTGALSSGQGLLLTINSAQGYSDGASFFLYGGGLMLRADADSLKGISLSSGANSNGAQIILLPAANTTQP